MPTSRLPQLQLEDYWIDELTFRAEHTHPESDTDDTTAADDAGTTPTVKVDWSLMQSPDAAKYLLAMKVRFAKVNHLRVRGTIAMSGLFSLSPEVPDERRHTLLEFNAPSIVFGLARTTLGNLSATAFGGKIVLPTTNLAELAERKGRRRTVQERA